MTSLTLQTEAGQLRTLPSVSATALKNSTAAVLDQVLTSGGVVVTSHDREKAVILSVEAFRRLATARQDDLEVLRSKFGGLLAAMQTRAGRRASARAFRATPAELGRAAVKAARRRG